MATCSLGDLEDSLPTKGTSFLDLCKEVACLNNYL
jgi:hypothetical protein